MSGISGKVVPAAEQEAKRAVFRNRKFTKSQWPRISADQQNSSKSANAVSRMQTRMLTGLATKNARLASLGIDYAYPVPAGTSTKAKRTSTSSVQVSNRLGFALLSLLWT